MFAFFSLDMQWDPISFVGGCPCGCYLLLHFHWLEKKLLAIRDKYCHPT